MYNMITTAIRVFLAAALASSLGSSGFAMEGFRGVDTLQKMSKYVKIKQ
jgi:hypothetical protein